MARLLIFFSLLIALIGTFSYSVIAQDNEWAEWSQQAESAYLNGNYEQASELYTRLIENGVRDFAVYYNVGSASYQNGDLGLALSYFLEAQLLNPRSQALNLNIARIRAERVDYLPESNDFLNVLGSATLTIMSLRELQMLTLSLWSFWFGLWGIFFIMPSLRLRIRVFQWVSGALMMLFLVFMTSRMFIREFRAVAVVTSPVSQAMSGPGDDYLTLYRLFSAAELRVDELQDNWVRFSLGDGREGWILRDAIRVLEG